MSIHLSGSVRSPAAAGNRDRRRHRELPSRRLSSQRDPAATGSTLHRRVIRIPGVEIPFR